MPVTDEQLETLAKVCQRIEAGALIDDAAKAEGTDRRRVWEWARADERASDMYAHAREASAEALENEALRVSRDAIPGKLGNVDQARLLADTLKWAAAKRRPRVYGDKLDVTSKDEKLSSVVILPAIREDK